MKHVYIFTVPVLLALILSALAVRPAFADDSPPPSDTPTDAAPAPSDAPDTSANLSADAPQHTDGVVVDDEGRSHALASRKAADLTASGDPVWCPVGVAPQNGLGGCSPFNTTLSGLIAGFNPPPKAGVIWIEWGLDTGAEANITTANVNWADAAPFSLTLRGGWNGTYGSTGICNPINDPYACVSVFEDAINIIGWSGPVTVSNILIRNVTINNTYGGSGALNIDGSSAVTLKNVSALENTGGSLSGVHIVNGSVAQKPVTVTGGEFSFNNFNGLYVSSAGNVTLTNLVAGDNAQDGAFIDNTYSVGHPVYLNGLNSFTHNSGYGLEVRSSGLIRLSQVTASYNSGNGVYLDNSTPPAGTYPGVSILGYLTASHNPGNGLTIYSDGAVSLTNLHLDHSTGRGLYVDNDGGGSLTALPKPVTISGLNVFDSNGEQGVEISSFGAVTLFNVTATYNGNSAGSEGVYIHNSIHSNVQQGVTLAGYNVFTHNGYIGLRIISNGTVTLNNLTVEENGKFGGANGVGDGVYVLNDSGVLPRPVYVNGVNVFSYNDEDGLEIDSAGLISLSKVTAFRNGHAGVRLDNLSAPGPLPVLATGYVTVSDNGYAGFTVASRGAVTLYNVSAVRNGFAGVEPGVNIDNRITSTVQSNVTFLGPVLAYDNAYQGLYVTTYGAVLMSNVTANQNGTGNAVDNVVIRNSGGALPRSVTIGGVNVFNDGGFNGLSIYSSGPVSVSKVTALRSVNDGLYIDNSFNYGAALPTVARVLISGYGVFDDNVNVGLYVYSHGPITTTNLTANDNGGYGAYLHTTSALGNPGVTLSGLNTFNDNGDAGFESGLDVRADGAILVSNVTANYNYFNDATLDNWTTHSGVLAYNITIAGFGVFNDAGLVSATAGDGLHIDSSGNVLLNHVTANHEYDDGIDITVHNSKTVTLVCSGASDFSLYGLKVAGAGAIYLRGFLATNNWIANESLNVAPVRSPCP